jgi:NTE family protein
MPTTAAERPAVQGLPRRSGPSAGAGLVLTGGGARAAYQVGVLSALMRIVDPAARADFVNPFPIICGTSAGAINATALACRAHQPRIAVRRLRRLWSTLHTDMIYRADVPLLMRTGVKWLGLLGLGWRHAGIRRARPRSLLDNTPLGELLGRTLDFSQLGVNLERGNLAALAITASGYTTGEHLTFYQAGHAIDPWRRSLRQAIPVAIGMDHLIASSAIPFIFPARPLNVRGQVEWCGDGSMRQLAPISPAIHLGARRVLVIGTGHRDDTHPERREPEPPYPSAAQIGGHALSNIFLDSLSSDVERLEQVNAVLAHASGSGGGPAGPVPVRVLSVTPSRSLDTIALEHLHEMPREVLTLFRALGVSSDPDRSGGASLMSYLLFESGYTRRLIDLGYADTMQRIEEVVAFFQEAQA